MVPGSTTVPPSPHRRAKGERRDSEAATMGVRGASSPPSPPPERSEGVPLPPSSPPSAPASPVGPLRAPRAAPPAPATFARVGLPFVGPPPSFGLAYSAHVGAGASASASSAPSPPRPRVLAPTGAGRMAFGLLLRRGLRHWRPRPWGLRALRPRGVRGPPCLVLASSPRGPACASASVGRGPSSARPCVLVRGGGGGCSGRSEGADGGRGDRRGARRGEGDALAPLGPGGRGARCPPDPHRCRFAVPSLPLRSAVRRGGAGC